MKKIAKETMQAVSLRNYADFSRKNKYNMIMAYLRRQLSHPFDNNTKLPIAGKKYLYLVNPTLGLKDKSRIKVLAVGGNERFCKAICKYAAHSNKYQSNL